MTNKKEETDEKSIELIMAHLAESGFTSIRNTNEEDEHTHYDIYSEWKGKKILFELKERTIDSDVCYKAMVRERKIEYLQEIMDNDPSVAMIYLVFIYTDDIFYMIPITNSHTEGYKTFKATERFANQEEVKQKVWYYTLAEGKKFPIKEEIKKQIYNG